MDRQPWLVVNYGDLIIVQSNVMCNLNYSLSGFHHRLMHEFYHGLVRTITPMFFIVFGHCQKFKQWLQRFIFQHWMALLQQMRHNGKLNNFPSFFSYHPMCQLGINSPPTIRCKCFLVLGMLTNLGVKPIPFFTLDPIFLTVFWWLACLQRESHLVTSILFFPSTLV
jgi:hypothetical protein